MIALALVTLLLSSAGTTGSQATVSVTQLTVTQSVIIRVPARRTHRAVTPAPPPPMPQFKERKGPGCIDAESIAGAAVSAPDSVDFILRGGKRVRAQLEEECPALDYYSGFYVRPAKDGKICADRDSIHTRSGGDCQIDRFRLLVPKR